jgi:lipopolysaccharide export system protein LptC
MRKRTAHRWRLSLTMLVFVLIALGSFWLVEVVNKNGQDMQADAHRNEPDYIVGRFSFVRLNKAGQPAYIISGDQLTHRPVEDASDVDKPVVRSLSGDQPPLHMHAERAHIDQDNSRIKLIENVHIEREGSATAQPMDLRTQALTVFPDDDTMETDQPVQMRSGDATASGIGLHANNATRQLELGGRGHLTIPPRSATAARP